MLQFVFDDWQHLLISLARGLKYFYDVELLYSLDEFQRNWIFYRGNIKQKHHFYRVADKIKPMFLFKKCNLRPSGFSKKKGGGGPERYDHDHRFNGFYSLP